MTQKEVLFNHASDKKRESYENSMITNTNFLSLDERADIVSLEKILNTSVKTFYYGGYCEAERTVAVFIPDFFEIGDNIEEYFDKYNFDNPLAVIRVTKDRFSFLTHRDYLGSLMGLGIKREMIGDILVDENGAYIFCLKKVAYFICENLIKIGKGSVLCAIIDRFINAEMNEKCEIRFHSVASLRLDNVLSAGFGFSRNACVEAIYKGVVFVNSVKVLKNDAQVKEKDKIVLRGKGKIVVDEVLGENKKGRIHIHIKHYN